MQRIINNKRIDLTDEEYKIYEELCASYNRDNFNGKDLFNDLFETDDEGIIIFLRPPKTTFSMEIIIYLNNIMTHQHLRKIASEHNLAMKEFKQLKSEITELLTELKKNSS